MMQRELFIVLIKVLLKEIKSDLIFILIIMILGTYQHSSEGLCEFVNFQLLLE